MNSSNLTVYSSDGPDLAMAISACIFGAIGIVLNGFILYMGIKNKEMGKKDFIVFVMNRTMIDFVYSLALAVFQPVGIIAPHLFPYSCEAVGFLDVALACTSAAAEPMLACNRFVSVCYRSVYDRLYKKQNNLYFMCTAVWIMGVFSAVPHIFFASLGRVTGVLCAVRFEMATLVVTLVSNYILVSVSLTLVAYFNLRILASIRKHQRQQLTNSQKSKLQKDGEIVRFIFVSAVVPLALQMPATLGLFVRMYDVNLAPDWGMFTVTAVFATCPALNPIISAMMVKPIKQECKRMLGMTDSKIGPSTIQATTISVMPQKPIKDTEL